MLDALGCRVEARRQPRHFISALDFDACRQIAASQLLDALLQTFEPMRQPPGHGPCRERDQRGHRREESNQTERDPLGPASRRARHDPTTIGKRDGPGRSAGAANPATLVSLARARHWTAGGCDGCAVGVDRPRSMCSRCAMRWTASRCSSIGASAGGSANWASSPATSKACLAGGPSAARRHKPPPTRTTASRPATIVR